MPRRGGEGSPSEARTEPAGKRSQFTGGTAAIGRRVGRYSITGVLGEGGMGVVYVATQDRPNREVALKLIRSGHASHQQLRRFEFEAELLGRLTHPGIAQIYEAGIDEETGSPYFAMELIKGESLTAYAARRNPGTRERMRLFSEICLAVQHAHAKGVIHRDLKPSNILVEEVGDPPRPQPKILDFGVARLTDSDTQTTTLRTDIGQLIGTVPYMSPEQVGGDPRELDTRSDVYALGVVLYELLVDRLPYNLANRMIHEAVRVIREEEPTRLSSIDRALRGDVETIVAKALEKERERRYQSAGDLASDIHRYLTDEPITARPAGTWYQVRKFSRRHKALVAGVSATLVVLVAGIVGTTTFAFRAEARRLQAEEAQRAESRAKVTAQESAAAAELAEKRATARAEELKLVTEFQAHQLSGVDVPRMGQRLHDDLLRQVREANAGDAPDAAGALEQSLAAVDFTGTALRAIGDNVLGPALEAIAAQFAAQPLVRASLLQTVADTAAHLGILDMAVAPQEEALAIRREQLGNESPDTLASIGSAATLKLARGDLAGAEALYRESLDGKRRVLGDRDPQTLASIGNMAGLLANQGRLAEAEKFYREAVEGRRAVLGDEHPDTLNSLANLGTLLAYQGKFDEAEAFMTPALEGRRRALGDTHPDTLVSMANLGRLRKIQGRTEEAEKLLHEAVEGYRAAFGDDHPSTLNTTTAWAGALDDLARHDEAERLYRQVLDRQSATLGADHPSTLVTRNNLATLLHQMGRLDEAEPLYREVLEAQRRLLGDDHPQTLSVEMNLGALLQSRGDFAGAETILRDVVETSRRILGDDHPDTLRAMLNLGDLLQLQDRLDEAETLFRETLERRRRALGDDHPSTLNAMAAMVDVIVRKGRYAEAEPLALERERRTRAAGREEDPDVSDAVQALVDLYTAWHEAEPDAGHDQDAARWREKLGEGERSGSG